MSAPKQTPLSQLAPAGWNPRKIKDDRFDNLCKSIQADPDFLRLRPILAQSDGTIYAGNMRWHAAKHLGLKEVWAVVEDVSDQVAKERALRDNAGWGENVDDQVGELLAELKAAGSDIGLLGFDSPELDRLLSTVTEGEDSDARPALSDRFLVPPFSVLDARQGYWQERKRRWLSLGIESELGRGDQSRSSANAVPGEAPTYRQIRGGSPGPERAYAVPSGSLRDAATLGSNGKTVRGDGKGRKLANGRDPARTFGQDLMRGEHTVGRNG